MQTFFLLLTTKDVCKRGVPQYIGQEDFLGIDSDGPKLKRMKGYNYGNYLNLTSDRRLGTGHRVPLIHNLIQH